MIFMYFLFRECGFLREGASGIMRTGAASEALLKIQKLAAAFLWQSSSVSSSVLCAKFRIGRGQDRV